MHFVSARVEISTCEVNPILSVDERESMITTQGHSLLMQVQPVTDDVLITRKGPLRLEQAEYTLFVPYSFREIINLSQSEPSHRQTIKATVMFDAVALPKGGWIDGIICSDPVDHVFNIVFPFNIRRSAFVIDHCELDSTSGFSDSYVFVSATGEKTKVEKGVRVCARLNEKNHMRVDTCVAKTRDDEKMQDDNDDPDVNLMDPKTWLRNADFQRKTSTDTFNMTTHEAAILLANPLFLI